MIRLKDILFEQSQGNADPFGLRNLLNPDTGASGYDALDKLLKKRNKRDRRDKDKDRDDNKSDLLVNVLFIGDEETDAQFSYANQLLTSSRIKGDIVADKYLSTKKLKKLMGNSNKNEYDVVSILDSGNDPTKISSKQSILNLIDMFKKAKKYNATVIVISSSEKDEQVHDWIKGQSITDHVIDVDEFSNNTSLLKTGFFNKQVHDVISRKWIQLIFGSKTADIDKDITDKTIINLGDSGETVVKIQKRLIDLGYDIDDESIGTFDLDTEAAVKDFQEDNSIEPYGVVDEETTRLLFSDDAISNIQDDEDDDEDDDMKTSGRPEPFIHYAEIIIDKFEGGYFNPDMPQGDDPVYARSGETMMGIDRLRSSYETDTAEGQQFWEIIDANSGWAEESDGEDKWTYNYRGGELEKQLTQLVGKIMQPQHQKNFDKYLSKQAKEIVNSDYNLTFHFVRATWNGSGWFQYFARKINEAIVNDITSAEELMSVAMDSRINTTYTNDANSKELIRRSGEKLQKELKPYD